MTSTKLALEVKSIPPFRDVAGRFSKAIGDVERHRDSFRVQGRRLYGLVVDEAPERTGEFKSKLRWYSFVGKDSVGVRVTMPQPLGGFITGGTKPHVIAARNAQFLRFYWAKVGRVVFFRSVNHPGTKANSFTGRAYRRWLPGARRWLQTISRDFTRTIVKGH